MDKHGIIFFISRSVPRYLFEPRLVLRPGICSCCLNATDHEYRDHASGSS